MVGNERTQRWKRTIRLPAVREILRQATAFVALALLSRAALPDGLMPFAPAAAGAAWIAGLPAGALIGCLAGAASRLAWDALVSTAVTLACAWGLKLYVGRVVSRQVMLAVAAGELAVLLLFRSITPYDGLMGILSAAAALLLTRVYQNAFETLRQLRVRKLLTEEEVISLSIAAGTLLVGLLDVQAGGLSLSCVLGGAAVEILAYTGGAGAGAAAGVALGVMLAMGGKGEYLSLLGLCGVIAGGMKRLGRGGAALGCVLASAAMAVYARQSVLPVLSGALSAVLFLLTPASVVETVGRFVNASLRREKNQEEYLLRLREMTGERLREFADAFEQMGAIFTRPVRALGEREVCRWELEALRPLCDGCPAKNRCWSDEERLRAELEQVMHGFETPWRLARCQRIESLAEAGRALLRAHDRERLMALRAENNTILAGKQLKGVAAVVRALSGRMDRQVRYDDRLEARILQKLESSLTPAQDAIAQWAGGRLTVTVRCETCTGQCGGRMRSAVSAACGRSMRLATKSCAQECRAVYEESRLLEVHAGVARRAKGTVCGDTALAEGLPDGKYLLAISDGMGSGERAARESADAIALLEKLYQAGIDREAALEAVNRLLLLRSTDDMYSTLDCCCVDLMDGHCECAKLSAAPTVWVHGQGTTVFRGESLPAGILEEAPPEVYSVDVSEGDWLFFVSDGVSDALGQDLERTAGACACGDPQAAALCLLETAAQRGAGDDMTVIAARMVGGQEP